MGGDTLTKTLWLPVAVRTGMCRGHGKEGDTERQGFSSREILLPLLLPALGEDSPEEAFAAFTGHSVEVKARGPVSAHPADPRHVPVEVAGVGQGGAGRHCLHPCGNSDRL